MEKNVSVKMKASLRDKLLKKRIDLKMKSIEEVIEKLYTEYNKKI